MAHKRPTERVRHSTCAPLAPAHTPLRPPRVLTGALRCSERYAVEVCCGGRAFLFTRHLWGGQRGNHIEETLVRVAPSCAAGAVFAEAQVGLDHTFGMSANAGFTCRRGTELVAIGGHGNSPSGLETRVADATAPLPLVWGPPQRAISGQRASTDCIDESYWHRMGQRDTCEYDGKLSLIHHGGAFMLFARANLATTGGRHVVVSRSLNGVNDWGRFRPLRFACYNVSLPACVLRTLTSHAVSAAVGPSSHHALPEVDSFSVLTQRLALPPPGRLPLPTRRTTFMQEQHLLLDGPAARAARWNTRSPRRLPRQLARPRGRRVQQHLV